jgi:hypothetical protein
VAGTSQAQAAIAPNSFYAAERSAASFDVIAPFLASTTSIQGVLTGIDANHFFHQSFSSTVGTQTSSYNGFTIFNSTGNFVNGSVSVYGYRKS